MGIRLSICSVFVSLALVSSGAAVVAAEPTAACRSLALGFGAAAAQLDAQSLVNLGTCVVVEIGARAGAADTPAASPGGPASQPSLPTVEGPSVAPIESS